MHLKVFVKLKKTLKTLSSGPKNPKKPKKNQKKPKKPIKTQKNPLGWFFFLNLGFFQPCFIMQKVYFSRLMRVCVGLKGLSHEMDLAFDDLHG
jgi:hypothetical protein